VRVAVVGAGLMGHGMAQVFAVAGHEVRITDRDERTLGAVRERVRQNLARLGQDVSAAERVEPVEGLEEALDGAEAVFEAVYEDLALKRRVFREMEACAPATALIATNTSVLRISEVVGECATRERMLGTHWWNPPYLIPLVEVTPTEWTAPEAVTRMMDVLAAVGKRPVHVRKDVPGFIGNRLQHALWREAFALIDEGICDAETVDVVVRSSFGLRLPVLGPVANADLVGLDLTAAIHRYILPHLSTSGSPARVIEERVAAGHLGMKTGQGLLPWTGEEAERVRRELDRHLVKAVEDWRQAQARLAPGSSGGETGEGVGEWHG
jgi:3-hydroxybutyryl-CoA dehydrogenase